MSDMSDAYREMVLEKLAALEKERDEWERESERQAARAAKAETERDAALADNAALVRIIIEAGEAMRKKRKPDARFVAISMVGDIQCEGGHPGAALLEEHRKALVRARNEGLEKAAMKAREMGRTFRADGTQRRGASGDALLMAASCASDIANAIDALKEPES